MTSKMNIITQNIPQVANKQASLLELNTWVLANEVDNDMSISNADINDVPKVRILFVVI